MAVRGHHGLGDQGMKNHVQSMPTFRGIREAHGLKSEYEQYLPLSRYFFRPFGFLLTWVAIRAGWTSEGVSWLSGLVGLAGCALLVSGSQQLLLVGIGLLFLFNLLDCVDGSIARTMKTQNPYGRFLDSICGGVIDLAFWGIVGIMAFQHPHLLHWPQPFGYGPVFWLAVGGLTCFTFIWMGYLEMCFDELLRPTWDRIQKTEAAMSSSVSAVDSHPSVESLNRRPAAICIQAIMTNLRVRETHYALLLVAYMTATVDLLLAAYLIYFLAYNVSLVLVYAKRGRQIRALDSTGRSSGNVREKAGE
jgi:phosphatidylglycerophosphate synthase